MVPMRPSNRVEVEEVVRNLDILVEGHVTAPVHPEVAVHVVTVLDVKLVHKLDHHVQLPMDLGPCPRGLLDLKPSVNGLTVNKLLQREDHLPYDLSAGVVLVPHVEDEVIRVMADLDLEYLVPVWIEAVIDDTGLCNPALTQLDIYERIGNVLFVEKLAEPLLHVFETPNIVESIMKISL